MIKILLCFYIIADQIIKGDDSSKHQEDWHCNYLSYIEHCTELLIQQTDSAAVNINETVRNLCCAVLLLYKLMEMSDEIFREHIARRINYSKAHDTIQSMTNIICFEHIRGTYVIKLKE